MSIVVFFESGVMKEHQWAFRTLVMIGRADGDFDAKGVKVLTQCAVGL